MGSETRKMEILRKYEKEMLKFLKHSDKGIQHTIIKITQHKQLRLTTREIQDGGAQYVL